MMLIPFDLPSCGPVTVEESQLYMKFSQDCEVGKYSSLVGWVVKQGKALVESGNTRIQQLREELQCNTDHSMVSRNVVSWAICLYFLEKVCHCISLFLIY